MYHHGLSIRRIRFCSSCRAGLDKLGTWTFIEQFFCSWGKVVFRCFRFRVILRVMLLLCSNIISKSWNIVRIYLF